MTATSHSPLLVWIIIVAGGLGTFSLRYSFIGLFGYFDELPAPLKRALALVPAAVLAALIVPELVYLDGTLVLSPANDRLLAGLVAAVVARRTENMLATIGVGMLILWGLSLV